MTRITAFILASLALAVPAWVANAVPARAADAPRPVAPPVAPPVAQVPLVPPAETLPDDVATLVYAFWSEYYNGSGENAFSRDNLRLGRIDLDGDDRPELVLMIDAPGWEAEHGNPFVVAQWRKNRWIAVGWGWGDEDTVFATTDVQGGWRSIDGGKVVLTWAGKEYRAEIK